MSQSINTIIFDLGGVLIDWSPRYLFRKMLKSEEEVSWFLENVCTGEWNDHQDAGKSFAESRAELLAKHPDWKEPIHAWHDRWQEMIAGQIQEAVDILKHIKDSKSYRLLALTNWSAESFPWALDNFEFLHWFEGIVVSGTEKTRKPFPEIYEILFKRYNVNPANAIFIDDNIKNIDGAHKVGLNAIHFQSSSQLKDELKQKGLI